MTSRRFALPTLLAALLGLVVAALRLDLGEADAGSPLAAKLADAERTIVYALTPESGPRFRLPGGPETLLLIAHLQLPAGQPYVAEQSYRYGVVATLRGPDGAALHRWTLARRARQTKAGPLPDGRWTYEAAFVPDGRLGLTDGGGVELELPSCPPDSTLELAMSEEAGVEDPAGELAESFPPIALVRLYRRVPLEPAVRELRALRRAQGSGGTAGASYLPWYALPREQQLQRLDHAWERLAPEGHTGADYRNYSIYVAERPPPEPPAAERPMIEVGAGQPAIVHLRGPGMVVVRARLPAPAADPAALELRARWLGALDDPKDMSPSTSNEATAPTGEPAPETIRALELPADAGWAALALPIPAGWTALGLHTSAPRALLAVEADDVTRHAGPDRHALHRGPDARPFVPVDFTTRPLYRAGPALPPLQVDLAGPADIYARELRIDARSPGAAAPIPLRVEFLDAEGRTLAGLDETLTPPGPAPWGRLRRAWPALGDPDVLDARDPDEGAGFPLGEGLVSDAVTLRLLAPAGALRARVAALAPALLELRGQLPPPPDPDLSPWTEPYDQLDVPGERWRGVPLRRLRWFSLRARDHRERLAAGEVALLLDQARREARPDREDREGPWRAEHPRGAHARVRLLERVPPERRAEALARWGPGRYAALRRGHSLEVDLGRGAPQPARLRFQLTGVGTAAIGQTMEIATDGALSRWRLHARAGQRPLPGRGRATIAWRAGPEGALLLVDRPPLSPAPLYTRRQLHRLGAGGLTLRIDKPGPEALALNLALYWLEGPPAAGSEIRVTLDGGAPRRRAAAAISRLTPGDRVVRALPGARAEVLFGDSRGEARVAAGRVAILLGDDLAPGPHTIRLELAGGAPLWARFFRRGAPRPAARAWQWNERRGGAIIREDSDEEDD